MSDTFQEAVTRSEEWLRDLAQTLRTLDDRQTLRALRAGLHALRDRLPAPEVVDLGAQLPMLIRGLYYEGWRFANNPGEIRTRAQIVERVRNNLRDPRLDPEDVLQSVIRVLALHVSTGQLEDMVGVLPKPIAELWEESTM